MNNLSLGERLQALRSEHGYSQEQLADLVGVSRQAVSKWETGSSMPDIDNLVRLSELYGQSLDTIVKGIAAESAEPQNRAAEQVIELDSFTSGMVRVRLNSRHYEYKSKAKIFGVPLVHINIGRKNGKLAVARGIVAIGTISIGAVSMGLFSLGLLSVGVFTLGMAALGTLSAGILSAGVMAVGALSYGIVSIGYFATGVTAVGVYARGVAAIASRVAVGVAAAAPVAIGTETAEGMYTLLVTQNTTIQQVQRLIELYAPELSGWMLRSFIGFAKYL